jgi:hypothetical protein
MRIGWLSVLVLLVAACAPAAPPSPSAPATFEEFATNACTAFQAMFRAIGNPDTGSESELSAALNEAVERGDPAGAGRVAQEIAAELARGREAASRAAAWPPAAPMMREFNDVLAAFEAMLAAKQAAAADPTAADPQAAFEAAGGVSSWTAMLEQAVAIGAARPTGEPPHECEGVPIGF